MILFKQSDITNIRIGKLTVIRKDCKTKYGHWKWECVCDCGKTVSVAIHALRGGTTKSCGCLKIELHTKKMLKHGGSRQGEIMPEYVAWLDMIKRCTKSNSPRYHRYGGRGIKVCERWMNSFSNFLEDMGERTSSKHSIDRKDNDGNYEPDNCRWATSKEQANNRSTNKPKGEGKYHII